MSASIAYGVVLAERYTLSDAPITPRPEDTRSGVTLLSFGNPDWPQHAVVLESTVRRTQLVMTTGISEITEAQKASIYAFCIRHDLRINTKHNLGEPTWLVFAHGIV